MCPSSTCAIGRSYQVDQDILKTDWHRVRYDLEAVDEKKILKLNISFATIPRE
jgi:hypothetical protein